jgi:chorismate dehydratase
MSRSPMPSGRFPSPAGPASTSTGTPDRPGALRLGAVGYLNARPHVFGLETAPRFALRFDVPSRCAELLHEGAVDVGLIPSIEYLYGDYRIVPDVAIASRGPVASVALFTTRPIGEVRSIALDTSSRTSVALLRVLCARAFGIQPALEPSGPDLTSMLSRCDAALMIGDNALFLEAAQVRPAAGGPLDAAAGRTPGVAKIDLGAAWTGLTGLPFVYAFWAGRPDALTAADVRALQRARDGGLERIDEIARAYCSAPEQQAVGARYLRDNIKYYLGAEEQAGLELFYRYAVEAGAAPAARALRFYPAGEPGGARATR